MDAFDGLQFHMQKIDNDTFHATVLRPNTGGHRHRHHYNHHNLQYDDTGALYYVVAVVLIYGISIVMLIASHIKKNKMDSHISIYLKEIAVVRKQTRRDQIICATAKSTPPMIPKSSKGNQDDRNQVQNGEDSFVSSNLYDSEVSAPSSPFTTQFPPSKETQKFMDYPHVRFIDEDNPDLESRESSTKSELNTPLLKISECSDNESNYDVMSPPQPRRPVFESPAVNNGPSSGRNTDYIYNVAYV